MNNQPSIRAQLRMHDPAREYEQRTVADLAFTIQLTDDKSWSKVVGMLHGQLMTAAELADYPMEPILAALQPDIEPDLVAFAEWLGKAGHLESDTGPTLVTSYLAEQDMLANEDQPDPAGHAYVPNRAPMDSDRQRCVVCGQPLADKAQHPTTDLDGQPVRA